MDNYENTMSRACRADAEAASWERMAREAEDSAKRYRHYAKNERVKAADYRELASRQLEEINKALEGIAA